MLNPCDLTILVNSCDSFEDCWLPFFTLLKRYWGADTIPNIVLITEKKEFTFDGLPIRAAQVQTGSSTMTWSQCLLAAIDRVETDFILYLQEDYFIDSPINLKMFFEIMDVMRYESEIKYIGLTHFGNGGKKLETNWPYLKKITRCAPYRISTQAGIWRKATLRSYLKEWENGWMFELYGTLRAWRRNDLFLVWDPDQAKPIISYGHTGIIKGKWAKFVPELFECENIKIDFSDRGFYDDTTPAWRRRLGLFWLIMKSPLVAFKSLVST